jgi:hypothetical protein
LRPEGWQVLRRNRASRSSTPAQPTTQQPSETDGGGRHQRNETTRRLDEQARKLHDENEERKRRSLVRIEEDHTGKTSHAHQAVASRTKQLETVYAENVAKLEAARNASRQATEADWRTGVLPLWEALHAGSGAAEKLFLPWRAELWQQFSLPDAFAHSARFGELDVHVEKFCGVALEGKGLVFPGPAQFTQPLLLSVPRQASLLFETKQSGQEQIIGALNNLVLRLLTSAPPGRLPSLRSGGSAKLCRHHAPGGF